MMTKDQAFDLFRYADQVMLYVGLATFITSIGCGLYAIFPWNKGRRRQLLSRAAISFLVFALFYGTQLSVIIPFVNEQWTTLLMFLFALPMVMWYVGLIAAIVYMTHGILRKTEKQRWQTVLISLLAIIVFGVGAAPHTAAILGPMLIYEDHANRPGTLTHVGEPVPDFELTDVQGTPFHTVNLRGQVIVLSFFATWCGPCQMELPHLQTIWDEFQNSDDFRMLAVGREESCDSLKTFRQKYGFTLPMAADRDASIFHKFATQSVPRTYLISRQGTIVYQCTGYYEKELSTLKKLLNKELAKKN